MRAPVSSAIAFSFFAMTSECSRDSITHGPAKKTGGAPAPAV
jgi:hypothetical protein